MLTMHDVAPAAVGCYNCFSTGETNDDQFKSKLGAFLSVFNAVGTMYMHLNNGSMIETEMYMCRQRNMLLCREGLLDCRHNPKSALLSGMQSM